MKRIVLLFATIGLPLFANGQFCVTTFHGDDFGLNDIENQITVLEIDSSGHVWFGLNSTFNGNVGKFTGSEWITVDHTLLPDPRPNAIAFDKDDSVWIATPKGIGILHKDALLGRKLTPDNSGLPEQDVTALAVDQENTKWIGLHSGKIAKYKDGTWEEFSGIATSSVRIIEIANDSSIWAGFTESPGLAVNQGSGFAPVPGFTSVSAIAADRWGRVLVASHDSLVIFSDPTGAVIVKAAPGNVIRDVTVGAGSGIWASSATGLLYRRGDQFLRFSDNNSGVPASLSQPVEFDTENKLWFGYTYLVATSGRSGTGYLYRTNDATEAIVTASKPNFEFCFGDSLVLTADESNVSYVWPDGTSTENTYTVYDSVTEIPVAVETDNRCYFYDTVTAVVQHVYEDEVVCTATIDASEKVVIVWERTPDVGTASYNIYREEGDDDYQFIGNVPANLLSVFEDPTANPYMRAYRYKITSVDTCQNESGKSFYHQTIHLTASKGALPGEINLHWVKYEGIDVGQYLILRGEDPLNLEIIDSVPGSIPGSYTDTAVFDTVYYRIGFRLPSACDPDGNTKAGAGPYHQSLSNLDNTRHLVGIPEAESPHVLNAWPNPMTDRARIEFPPPRNVPYRFFLYDAGGKLVREIGDIRNGELMVRREKLTPGFYFFELMGERNYRGKLLIR